MTLRQLAFSPAVLVALSLRLAAHDYWFEPSRLFGAPGDVVEFKLLVGEHLKAEEEREYQRLRTERLDWSGAGGRVDLRDQVADGAKPFATASLDAPGLHVLELERMPSLITLEGDKFTDYLREEGLGHVIDEREKAGESNRPGRERYRRSLKAYVWAGDGSGEVPSRALRLDIRPEFAAGKAPATGDGLAVRVSFDQAPLAGVSVFASGRDAAGAAHWQQATTDAAGVVRFKLTQSGLWVVRLVHMRRAPAGDAKADWESFWAACTFGVK